MKTLARAARPSPTTLTFGYEVMPLAGALPAVLAHVPTSTGLSVTASPSRGQDVTVDLAVALAEAGYSVAPHLSARLLGGPGHLEHVLGRCREAGVDGVFVVGGDPSDRPTGYPDALSVLEALHAAGGSPFRHVGVAGHPEGIPGVSDAQAMAALVAKAPLATHITTQMTFRPDVLLRWARDLVARGVLLPVHAGVPGAVSRQRLLRVSARIGVAESAKYLARQQGVARRFFAPSGYRPDALVRALAPHLGQPDNGLSAFHVFTFNELEATELWRRRQA